MQLVDVMNNMTDPIVLCAKEAPHQIIHANKPWLEMCGYDQEEVEGLTNKILTGPETDKEATKRLMECVRRREPSMQTLINYKKGGVRFVNKVKTMPVHDDNDDLAGFMSMLHEVPLPTRPHKFDPAPPSKAGSRDDVLHCVQYLNLVHKDPPWNLKF